ncbi:MAG: metallophosphoesterase family protein [Planctomycetaceae bacterium]
MPFHTVPLSRRSFLTQGTAAIAGLSVVRYGWGDQPATNPNVLALLSDTHIPESPEVSARGTNMTANLTQVVQEITQLVTKPAGVIINGDCAYLKGLSADYENLARCVAPLGDAGLPLHVTMGNHDDRAQLYASFQAKRPDQPIVEAKHVTVIETPRANWFLLDSLTQVNVVTGELGAVQREWLAQALAARTDKPAFVIVHHNPQFEPPAADQPWGGIRDTKELMALLTRHKQVKALIFGHSHNWSIARHGDLNLVNLPPVAYVFAAGKPNGWVRAEVLEDRLVLELRTIDPAHKQHGERVELAWA